MKKGLVLIVAMITMFFYAEKSEAAFLLEPYAGLNVSSTYQVGTQTEGTLSGSSVGARVGFTQLGLMLGLNGQRGTYTLSPATGSDSDFTFTKMGFFVGYDFPVMLRIWGEYVFSYEGVDVDNTDNKRTEGSGTTFGFGYKIIPFVSLNLEVSNLSTAKYKTATAEVDSDVDYTQYMLSVSLPLSI
jgi:hypothetical protein